MPVAYVGEEEAREYWVGYLEASGVRHRTPKNQGGRISIGCADALLEELGHDAQCATVYLCYAAYRDGTAGGTRWVSSRRRRRWLEEEGAGMD